MKITLLYDAMPFFSVHDVRDVSVCSRWVALTIVFNSCSCEVMTVCVGAAVSRGRKMQCQCFVSGVQRIQMHVPLLIALFIVPQYVGIAEVSIRTTALCVLVSAGHEREVGNSSYIAARNVRRGLGFISTTELDNILWQSLNTGIIFRWQDSILQTTQLILAVCLLG